MPPNDHTTATKRLANEIKEIKKNPIPNIIAEPDPSNILFWHFIIFGPKDTEYENGVYHGELIFTSKFPYEAPKIKVNTPNGKFNPGQNICLSFSHFHQERWNPAWSISSMLVALVSFMTSNEGGMGQVNHALEFKKMDEDKINEYKLDKESLETTGDLFRMQFYRQNKERKEKVRKRSLASDKLIDNLAKFENAVIAERKQKAKDSLEWCLTDNCYAIKTFRREFPHLVEKLNQVREKRDLEMALAMEREFDQEVKDIRANRKRKIEQESRGIGFNKASICSSSNF